MKIIFEPGDFPAHSGKKLEDLADPFYGFTVVVEQRPNQLAGAVIKQHGSGWRVEPGQLVVEIAGKERATRPEPAMPTRDASGKFVKQHAEPVGAGTAGDLNLPRTDWYED